MVVEVLFSEPRLDAVELGLLELVPPTLLLDFPLEIDLCQKPRPINLVSFITLKGKCSKEIYHNSFNKTKETRSKEK